MTPDTDSDSPAWMQGGDSSAAVDDAPESTPAPAASTPSAPADGPWAKFKGGKPQSQTTSQPAWMQSGASAPSSAMDRLKRGMDLIEKNPQWMADPDTAPFVRQYIGTLESVSRIENTAALTKERLDLQRENSRAAVARSSSQSAWNSALGSAPPEVASAIDALPNQGWNVDGRGQKLSPSVDALRIYNSWRTNNGKNPELAFGYKPNSIETAKARATAASNLETQKQTNRKELKTAANEEWFKRERQRYTDKADLTKLQAAVRGNKTESQFIDKHLDAMRKQILADNPGDFESQDGKVDESKLMDAARSLLHYSWVQGGGAPSQTDTASSEVPWMKGGGDAAPKSDKSSDQSDPLGLLK